LYLYFNDQQGAFGDNSGSFTVTINGVTTNVPALDPSGQGVGVAVGTVTKGSNYTYSASGTCSWDTFCPTCVAGPNGTNDCSSINITNSICPAAKCFSLVGKIQ
jgi:hypothetical protein